ncbi:hypothetical protein [Tenacibaculum aiptasiae]|nr:hypothetical protein [Tenacibaculum aiptasiae]
MLKNISNLGTILNKTEQRSINGGELGICDVCKSNELPCTPDNNCCYCR